MDFTAKNVSFAVESVACFGSGHKAIYNSQLATLDVQFRKLCRSIVGPPPEVDWNAAWHGVLHLWNDVNVNVNPVCPIGRRVSAQRKVMKLLPIVIKTTPAIFWAATASVPLWLPS